MAKGKTVHVIQKNGPWVVQGEGSTTSVHPTQAQAVTAARHIMKGSVSGQFVVLGRTGRIVKSETHRMPKVQPPPRKSRLGSKVIEQAVSSVVLERLGA